ncbi:MAG: TetR/AcrR family transcriptional regulator [Myxococcota bacterium]
MVSDLVSLEPPQSRRERKKERTRRQIYASAMQLFSEQGFPAVTVEAICRAADVARGTFFLHFPTKASLLFEYNRQTALELGRELAIADEDGPAAFRKLATLLTDRWLAHGEVLPAMLRELLAHPEEFARAADEERDLAQMITAMVRRGQAVGTLRADVAPELVAAVFLSSSLAFLTGGLHVEPPLEPDAIRDQFLDLLLDGIAVHR